MCANRRAQTQEVWAQGAAYIAPIRAEEKEQPCIGEAAGLSIACAHAGAAKLGVPIARRSLKEGLRAVESMCAHLFSTTWGRMGARRSPNQTHNKTLEQSRGGQMVQWLLDSIDGGPGEADCALLNSMLCVSKMIERCNIYMMYSTDGTGHRPPLGLRAWSSMCAHSVAQFQGDGAQGVAPYQMTRACCKDVRWLRSVVRL